MVARRFNVAKDATIQVRSVLEMEDEICKALEKEERYSFIAEGGVVGKRSTHQDHELATALSHCGYSGSLSSPPVQRISSFHLW